MSLSIRGEAKRLVGRVRAIRTQDGIRELPSRAAHKALVYVSFPLHLLLTRRKRFRLGDTDLPYFVHPYNATWRSERAVEIPIALRFLHGRDPKRGVEIGNVLSYYSSPEHEVVDKYEREEGVRNIDVIDYSPASPLDWIVSVSTLEHVGWDEVPREPAKVREAISHLRRQLAPGGAMLVTCPRGYNAYLDAAISQNDLHPTREYFLRRTSPFSIDWKTEPRDEAVTRRGRFSFERGCAFDLWVAEFGAL